MSYSLNLNDIPINCLDIQTFLEELFFQFEGQCYRSWFNESSLQRTLKSFLLPFQ